eukprot:scaffold104497_cov18-Tisochrysis_lutea.AAC.2
MRRSKVGRMGNVCAGLSQREMVGTCTSKDFKLPKNVVTAQARKLPVWGSLRQEHAGKGPELGLRQPPLENNAGSETPCWESFTCWESSNSAFHLCKTALLSPLAVPVQMRMLLRACRVHREVAAHAKSCTPASRPLLLPLPGTAGAASIPAAAAATAA